MALSDYDPPGSGSDDIGYSLRVHLPGGKQFVAPSIQLTDDFPESDLQRIVDALAGIPGVQYVVLDQGRVTHRNFSPDRPYEPAPPPPE
jgi:hypothetical protein